jgi:hypothetical protein
MSSQESNDAGRSPYRTLGVRPDDELLPIAERIARRVYHARLAGLIVSSVRIGVDQFFDLVWGLKDSQQEADIIGDMPGLIIRTPGGPAAVYPSPDIEGSAIEIKCTRRRP